MAIHGRIRRPICRYFLVRRRKMAHLRRFLVALAVVVLTAGLASAQIGIAGAQMAGPLACTAQAAATPQLRSEGYSELVGDVLITCTGGAYPWLNSQVPSGRISVSTIPKIPVTSRLFGTGGAGVSEALLIIDDAGDPGMPSGATGPFGPHAPQVLCSDTAGGCLAYAGLDQSLTYYVACANYAGPSTPCAATAAN